MMGEPEQPSVFIVGADGNIVQRSDNVATEARLVGAVEALLGR
jgi:hypothetical protein